MGRRIVSSRRGRRNNSSKKVNDFNDRKATGVAKSGSSVLRNQCRSAAYRPSARAGHGGLGGRLDRAADSQIDGTISLNAYRPDLHVKQQIRIRDLAAPCGGASLRANGSGERPPDDRLREAIHAIAWKDWIASSQALLAMTLLHPPPSYPRRRVSSTPRVLDSLTDASEYWIVRLRGR
jgi:hypothetical protein